MAKTIFTATATSNEKLQVHCQSRNFNMLLDEPTDLGGDNKGMNPVEALLCSLGACKVIVAKSFARLQGIQLNSIRIDLSGELDPDGFMGKNPHAKIGFSQITSQFFIDADNTDDEINSFVEFINEHCPVQDSLAFAPNLITEIHRL